MKIKMWQLTLALAILFLILFPRLHTASRGADAQIEKAKSELLFVQGLKANRHRYEDLQRDLEKRGEILLGSSEIGDFLSELETVSKNTGVPISNSQPHHFGEGDSGAQNAIGAELEIEGAMTSLMRFVYETLRLPGVVTVERLSLSPNRNNIALISQVLVSRKVGR